MSKKIAFIGLSVVCALLWFSHTGHVALAAQAHPAGTLVQSGQTIWQIAEDGKSRLTIDSPEKFYSQRLSFNNVVPANAADLALAEKGSLAWGDGVLFADKGIIYQISGGKKHGFTSAEVFLGQGFTFPMARPGNLSTLSEGTSISKATARHLPGTLLKSPEGTIWLQTATSRQPFPSAAIFYSHGGNFNEVAPLNSADNSADDELVTFRTGTIVNDNGVIWVTTQNTKLGFPSAQRFLNFGFTFTVALTGSTSALTPAGTICGEGSTSPAGPVSSYTTPTITTSQGNFATRIASFNLSSNKVRVMTDTAADRDCATTCPVASLSAYLSVNGGQSGMNGTYFCPAEYAECSGKTNSFFWKVLDTKLGKVINANNGLGDEDPFLTFDSLGQAKYFRRFTDYKNSGFSASAGINSPSITESGTITLNYSKLDDKQRNTKAARGTVALKDQTLYLIHVLNATVPDTAAVLQSLGMDYALLLDGGGSAAMMYDGVYKTGPGRNIPNALIVQTLP